MEIDIEQVAEEPWEFQVKLVDGDTELGSYHVQVSEDEFTRFGAGAEPRELVEATFQFLLEREDPDMILEQFSVSDVVKYFPEYADTVTDYF